MKKFYYKTNTGALLELKEEVSNKEFIKITEEEFFEKLKELQSGKAKGNK